MARVALRRNPQRQQVSVGKSVPAPVGGWDAVSPLSAMKPEFAVSIENWFCQPGYIELRRGHVMYANTAVSGQPIASLMAYHGLTANKFYAAVTQYIFDVSAEGVATQVVSGLANARFQHVNFATTGGNYLWICNGADSARAFNGTAWVTPTITGAVASANIVNVQVHKNRLWFCVNGTLDAAYLPVDSFQGATALFALSGVFTKGGVLMAIATWSLDGGAGRDDHIAFISSRGEVAVYDGTNPASDFALIGVYSIAAPIGRRCILKVGGDVAVLTIEGVVPLSRALVTDQAAARTIALTQRIQPVMVQSARNWGSHFGWQIIAYPRNTMALLNVPITEGGQQVQYVMNTITGAWSKFTGWNANCFEIFNDRLFFGGNDGKVYEADRSGADNGSAILIDVRLAFNYFGMRGQRKRYAMARPIFTTDGTVTPSMAVNTDFRDDAALSTPASAVLPAARFDQANFDAAVFPVEQRTQASWIATAGIGYCASYRIRAQVAASGAESAEVPAVVFRFNALDAILQGGDLVGLGA